jgi:hypothetical protein
LSERARPPVRRAASEVDLVHSDYLDVDVYEQSDDDGHDEQGIHSGPGQPGRWQDNAFARGQELAVAIERIRAHYDTLITPMLSTQKRNGGVRLPAIARLEAERDAEVNALMRAHWKAEALDRAMREAPKYLMSAHERQLETAALTSFGNDLRRGHRGVSQTPTAGRPTEDVFLF